VDFAAVAYEEESRPWRIGLGSALSDYRGQAYMTQICQPKAGERALEIGTGSGFQVSILSRIVERAYSIEIIEPLGKAVAEIFKPLGYGNIETRIGDGYFGWPEVEGGFDIIIVTCVAQHVPPPCWSSSSRAAAWSSHGPALQARAVPLRLHQGRGGQGLIAQGPRRVLHPDDRRRAGHEDAEGRGRLTVVATASAGC
jgi:hypothetical protein